MRARDVGNAGSRIERGQELGSADKTHGCKCFYRSHRDSTSTALLWFASASLGAQNEGKKD